MSQPDCRDGSAATQWLVYPFNLGEVLGIHARGSKDKVRSGVLTGPGLAIMIMALRVP
jgi:hypothetical protein